MINQLFISYLIAAMVGFSGVMHFIKPAFFEPLIPPPFPKNASNYLAGSIELLLAALLLYSETQTWGGLGFMLLMIAFLPLHIWDFLKDRPALINKPIAFVRILFQFVLIYAGWWLFQG